MVEKLFRQSTDNVFIQAFRYVLSGALAYGVDYCSLIVFVEIFKIYYLTAALVAFLLGSITAYIMNVRWVFDKRTFENRYFEISIFIVIGIVGLILNQYIIWFFTENVNFHYLFSKLVATMIVVIWNFFARKYILFR
ncbi:MAG: GtrA family protein [Candidatus Omnitrophota bacterium]|nr:GtrA family protein [Candidatus Omnitrophota bacterium]